MRYGSVVTADTQVDCFVRARDIASQPHISINHEPLKLTVRREPTTGRWAAAWETR